MNRHPTTAPSALNRRAVLGSTGALADALGLGGGLGRAGAQDATPAASVAIKPNVRYGEADEQQLLLDLYRPPASDGLRPAVLLFHPGGMMAGERAWMSDAARGLADAGYVATAVGYRLFGGGTRSRWPVQLDDAQRADYWVRANAVTSGVGPGRIAAYGHAAGAQLAVFLGSRDTRDDTDPTLASVSSRVACVVDLAGSMDLTIPADDAETNAARAAILGGTLGAMPARAAYLDFSPIAFVDGQTAPFLILQGGADAAAQIADSRRMMAALQTAEVEVVYGEFPGLDHFAWDWARSGPWALDFHGHHLRPEA